MSATRLPWLLRFGGIAMQPRPFQPAFAVNRPSGINPESAPFYQAEDGSLLYVGDVIQVPSGPGVYQDLRDKYFRVTDIHDGRISLSLPYHDQALTRPYRPV